MSAECSGVIARCSTDGAGFGSPACSAPAVIGVGLVFLSQGGGTNGLGSVAEAAERTEAEPGNRNHLQRLRRFEFGDLDRQRCPADFGRYLAIYAQQAEWELAEARAFQIGGVQTLDAGKHKAEFAPRAERIRTDRA
jgi:hypothetical protein